MKKTFILPLFIATVSCLADGLGGGRSSGGSSFGGAVTNLGIATLSSATVSNNAGRNLTIKGAKITLVNGKFTPTTSPIINDIYTICYTNTTPGATNTDGLGEYIAWDGVQSRWIMFDPDEGIAVYYYNGSAWISIDHGRYDPPPTMTGSFTTLFVNGGLTFADGTTQDTAYRPQLNFNALNSTNKVTLGKSNIASVTDAALASSSIKINNFGDSHIVFMSLAHSNYINEAYFENQDGKGNRFGSATFGLYTNGWQFTTALKGFFWAFAASPEPHPHIMDLDTNGNLNVGGKLSATNGINLSATNTLTVTSTGVTNNTRDTYLVSVTAGMGLAVKDGAGNQFLAPVLNSTFPFKPNWRFTGTAVTGIAVIISK
jgi:hypothetical protein